MRDPSCEVKSESDENDIRTFAFDIINQFVKSGSEMEVNISAKQRKKIEDDMMKSDRVDRSLFDNAQEEIYRVMSRDTYPRYLANKKETVVGKKAKNKRKRINP